MILHPVEIDVSLEPEPLAVPCNVVGGEINTWHHTCGSSTCPVPPILHVLFVVRVQFLEGCSPRKFAFVAEYPAERAWEALMGANPNLVAFAVELGVEDQPRDPISRTIMDIAARYGIAKFLKGVNTAPEA